jgi:FHS family L-fucose permease-like MFS transporter
MPNFLRAQSRAFAVAIALTACLVALWGMGHRLYDTLAPEFSAAFDLSSYQWALTRSIYNLVYIVGAIPAALYALRFSYKAAILLGLGCICVGAFTLYPAAETHTVTYFLTAIGIMAFGWIVLEVTANPLAAALGSRRNFVQRLNFVQSFYPLGALAGVLIGRWLTGSHLSHPDASAVAIAHPYIVFGGGVLLLAFVFEEVRFPAIASERIRGKLPMDILAILRQPLFVFALIAQFCGVLVLNESGRAGTALVAGIAADTTTITDWLLWSISLLLAGRLIATALMSVLRPSQVLMLFTAAGVAAALLAAATGGFVSVIGVMGARLFVALIWPTVLGIAIRDTGANMKLATALMCIAGASSGVAYDIATARLPYHSPTIAMLLCAAGFLVVFAFALVARRRAQS